MNYGIFIAVAILILASLISNIYLFLECDKLRNENIALKRGELRKEMNESTDPVIKARIKNALDGDRVR